MKKKLMFNITIFAVLFFTGLNAITDSTSPNSIFPCVQYL